MKSLINLLIVLSLVFVGAKFSYNPKHHQRTFYVTLNKVSRIIEKKYKLVTIGSGGQAFGGPIKLFRLSFNAYAPLTKEQLRYLLLNISKDFVAIVNADEEVQLYLAKRPFTIENIDIIIFNHDKKGYDVFDPLISVARLLQSNLVFRTRDPISKLCEHDYEETYEEASRLIQTPKPPENEKSI